MVFPSKSLFLTFLGERKSTKMETNTELGGKTAEIHRQQRPVFGSRQFLCDFEVPHGDDK